MSTSRLDAMYRSFLITKFFTKGWGKPENLRRLFEFRKVVSNRDECLKLVERDYPVTITKEQNLADCRLLEGYFTTPLERHLPGIVPQIAQRAHFQVLLPNHWPQPHCKPVCLHLAGTGDHFFWRRRNLMVKPLLKEAGIGGIILENPFYGLRKPTDQVRSSLHNVSDIFVMGGCLVLESLVLFHWCERNGLGPLGVTGLSMGGHMASLAATNWPKPLVLVPCLSWSTASAVFLQGVMSHSINWDLLEDQYLSDGEYKDKLSKMVTIVDQAFLAGKKFARTYTETMETATQSKAETAVTKAQNAVEKAKNEIIVSGKVLGLEPNHNKYIVNSEVLAEIEKLNSELKKLLDEDKISRVLFDKLTSNEKFELESEDIDCINKLDKANLKQLLLKCKVAEIKKESFPQVPPNINDSTINMNTYQVEVDRTTPKYEIPLDLKSKTIATSTITETSRLQPNPADGKVRDPTVTADSNLQPILTATGSKKPTLTEVNETAKLQLTEANEPTAKVNVQPTLTAKEPQATNKLKPQKGKSNKKSWNVSDLTSDLWPYIPFLNKSSGKKIDISKIHWRDREALQFMRGIMDECTHLSNFSVPFDTSLIIAVCAQHDAYVPREDVGTLEEIWPGAEVRYVDAGHVSAYILHQSMFRSCIKEAFERSKEKWIDGKHVA